MGRTDMSAGTALSKAEPRRNRQSGAWCSAYDEWTALIETGSDAELLAAMLGHDDRANRLRQVDALRGSASPG